MEADTGNILIDELARKKAQLLSYGLIEVPKDILSNLSVERPKSGPSSGSNLVGFEFKGRRLKLVVSRKRERFRLQRIGNEYVILDRDEVFLKVKPLDLSTHAPGQVFISLDNRCIFNCLFCRRESIVRGEEKLLGFVRRHLEKGISSLSITSGVFPSVEGHVERIERFVKGIRKDYDDISIGVEVVVGSREDIERLRSAGVDEMKINLQFPTKKLFDAICGYMEYEKIL
ncbi:MAG TPA: radical SAM protein, partial [Thermoplasmatales archaeon]|nr:radical SAM protein [Thermoplasmatales archaeon]HEX17584.1 radical SAM protein [Thermoplasmatales archaeon]